MEIKVLNKTFDLLELVRMYSPHPVLPGEAAERLEIPRSTCVRLLKLLTEKGYLEQLSPRKGYTVGPILYLLGNNDCYRHRLTVRAKTLLESQSRELGCAMQLFMRWGKCRLILCGFNGDDLLNLELKTIRRYDLSTSISGRMLLSFAPVEEQKEIITSWGEEKGIFQNLETEEILEKLRTMRESRAFTDVHSGKFASALPLTGSGRVNMGIGAVWREENNAQAPAIMESLKKCASKLSDIITVETFG